MKKWKSTSSVPLAAAAGMGTAMILTLILTAAAAWLIHRELLNQSYLQPAATVILVLSSGLGTAAAIRKAGRQKLILAGTVGCSYFLILLLLTAAAFGGRYQGVAVSAGCIVAGSGAGGMLVRTKKRRAGTSRMKYR